MATACIQWIELGEVTSFRGFNRSRIYGPMGMAMAQNRHPFWDHDIPSGKLTVCELENGPVEIVDFPSYKMVDLSSSLCKRLPGRVPKSTAICGSLGTPCRHLLLERVGLHWPHCFR